MLFVFFVIVPFSVSVSSLSSFIYCCRVRFRVCRSVFDPFRFASFRFRCSVSCGGRCCRGGCGGGVDLVTTERSGEYDVLFLMHSGGATWIKL